MKIKVEDFPLNPGTYILGAGITVSERHVDTVAEATQIEILPSNRSIEKRLNRIWAPVTFPRAAFEISRL